MPTSSHRNLCKIIDIVIKLNPQRLLDVGSGFGKFGVLCREYLELCDGRDDYKNWIRTIDTIEIFSDYITPIHKFVYDNIYIGDAFEIIQTLEMKYDLILLIDILEHIEKEKGILLVNNCLKKSNSILISIPKRPSEQYEVFGNKFESHVSKWTKKELERMGHSHLIMTDESFIVLIADKNTIRLTKKTFLLEIFRPLLLKFLQSSRRFEHWIKRYVKQQRNKGRIY